MDETTRAAFERLLTITRSDTGQSRRVAAHDMATVFAYVAGRPVAEYPEAYRTEIEDVIQQRRPDVWAKATEAV
ncbi:MAG: hypothetical protein B7X67_28525 [Rhizobiales bacterium 39-66-18]|nr:MAG: hypothetical protein B7X67_28525 [Rhizobiales bacterium 39-66-18]